MFTGLVEGVGNIVRVENKGPEAQLGVRPEFPWSEKKLGESIAVNGVCLTVKNWEEQIFSVDVSEETLTHSNLGRLRLRDKVNLERALRLSDRLGGHLVTGHVDGVGKILQKQKRGPFFWLQIAFPDSIRPFIVRKGSVTVDGISLTVNEVGERTFELTIIPHTLAQTTLGGIKEGAEVNLETDIIGKYVHQFLSLQGKDAPETPSKVDSDFLRKHGFLR
ncbi:MAG TPA: riboflavin synthase [Thermodesulfobacteriota bacterium]|nr:riboflavin synthase [Thermodesulfobacteriota bacterium]